MATLITLAPSGPTSIQDLTERFKTRLPDDKTMKTAYSAPPEIHTKLKISHAKKGELRIICESAKYAQYLMGELRKIRSKDGSALNCFFADKTDNCACFYIAPSKLKVAGQETHIEADERLMDSEDTTTEVAASGTPSYFNKLNNYGVYQSKGDRYGNNKKLSLHCPNGETGRNKVAALLGLASIPSIEKYNDTIYFDPATLPYQVGNPYTIETNITINNGLRKAVTETSLDGKLSDETIEDLCDSPTLQPTSDEKTQEKKNGPKTYTGDDAQLVLHAAIQMTAPERFLYHEAADEAFCHDKMMIFNGTAFQQSGWRGSDHETLSLQWVSHQNDMKLAVTYYSYQDCMLSTIQKAATYLISFNETGSAMTAELIDIPQTEAISIAQMIKQRKDNSWGWEPIQGEIYVPTGAEIIDSLTEWARAINTKKLKEQAIPHPRPEISSAYEYTEWQKSRNNLEVVLTKYNLFSNGNSQRAQTIIAQLHNSLLNGISTASAESYTVRLVAIKGIMKILQEIDEAETKGKTQPSESSTIGPQDKLIFTDIQKTEITRHFKTLLDTAPTWAEKSLTAKAMMFLGIIVPIVGWATLFAWDYYRDKNYKEQITHCKNTFVGQEQQERRQSENRPTKAV